MFLPNLHRLLVILLCLLMLLFVVLVVVVVLKIAGSITDALLRSKGEQNQMEAKIPNLLPLFFHRFVKDCTGTHLMETVVRETHCTDSVSMLETSRTHTFPWINGWRRDHYDANRIKFTVIFLNRHCFLIQ